MGTFSFLGCRVHALRASTSLMQCWPVRVSHVMRVNSLGAHERLLTKQAHGGTRELNITFTGLDHLSSYDLGMHA